MYCVFKSGFQWNPFVGLDFNRDFYSVRSLHLSSLIPWQGCKSYRCDNKINGFDLLAP